MVALGATDLSPANAHSVSLPKTLYIGLVSSKLVIDLTYALQPGRDAQQQREDSDTDQDGRLQPDEIGRMSTKLLTESTFALVLTCNGRVLSPDTSQITGIHGVDLPTRSGADLHINARRTYTVNWSSPETTCVLKDRHKFPKWPVWAVVSQPAGSLKITAESDEKRTEPSELFRVDLPGGLRLRISTFHDADPGDTKIQ